MGGTRSALLAGDRSRAEALLASGIPHGRSKVEEDERGETETVEDRDRVTVTLADHEGLAVLGRHVSVGRRSVSNRGRVHSGDQASCRLLP